jgi:hypothetical protein
MKYFIRNRKDCISSFLLVGEEKKMEAGHKEKRFFLKTIACVCVTNGGEVWGLGVDRKGRWKKCRKRRRCVEGYGVEILKKWNCGC